MIKFRIEQAVTLPDICTFLAAELPDYDVQLKTSLVQYVEVKYSAFVAVWIRIKKNELRVFGGIPSTLARVAFGPLWIPLFLWSSFKRLEGEVARQIESRYSVVRI